MRAHGTWPQRGFNERPVLDAIRCRVVPICRCPRILAVSRSAATFFELQECSSKNVLDVVGTTGLKRYVQCECAKVVPSIVLRIVPILCEPKGNNVRIQRQHYVRNYANSVLTPHRKLCKKHHIFTLDKPTAVAGQ